ncbi:MAG: ABC transporter permease subunit [Planctomycetes bacterium]|nr:ABC transporter permease subunit [Planctomycetota bacterium]
MNTGFVSSPQGARTSARRLRADKIARWVVVAGGLGIIASILGILAFLLIEASPLLIDASLSPWKRGTNTSSFGTKPVLAVVVDETKTRAIHLDMDGVARVLKVAEEEVQAEKRIVTDAEGAAIVEARVIGSRAMAIALADGRIVVQSFAWNEDTSRIPTEITVEFAEPVVFTSTSKKAPAAWCAAFDPTTGSSLVVSTDATGAVTADVVKINEFTGEADEPDRVSFDAVAPLTDIALGRDLDTIVGATKDSRLLHWSVERGGAPDITETGVREIAHIGFLLGDQSLIVGGAGGEVVQFFPTRASSEQLRLTKIRSFESMPARIRTFGASHRNKAFVLADEAGNVGYFYGTTGVRSFVATPDVGEIASVGITPKGDGIVVGGSKGVAMAKLDDPHPEASFDALFSKVWYEGYDEPSYEWESSGGAASGFEPKFSLIPLIFGTLKATIFSMILAIPLAVLGAMFVSQFMHPRLRGLIKPAIEIMAAMPSVILGFVAALWLAPLLEVGFAAFLLMLVVLPLSVIAAGALWMKVPARIRGRYAMGSEIFVFVIAIAVGIGICILLDDPFESLLFGGDFPTWVRETLGIPYEQKNSVVIAIAMSFAVVPIIFSISEDAFSNVPRNLVAGSLALGANRWQTVTRVVLPTASPGIFSATMVGFGRAIGETMIVLMATGNTAIMEWNPFNGFRTLSANIATEGPETPVGSTHYRILFLTALLLFVLTFLINTLAEVVRIRLRKRYASL